MNTTLFRPVGLPELSLIWDKAMREFPPRLPQQPIFYPVANLDYARQIAREWNTRDEKSGFSGYVTTFDVESCYLSKYEPHMVGSSEHVEYWVPAAHLNAFNNAIRGQIRLEEGFFGAAFRGHVPDSFNLKGKDAIAQFPFLAKDWEYSRFDVFMETYANRKAIFLNSLFWAQQDFSEFGISEEQRRVMLDNLRKCWDQHHMTIPLPQGLIPRE